MKEGINMDILEIMRERHSVRQYLDREIPDEIRRELISEVIQLNAKSGLHMQLFFDEPKCFQAALARYGKFTNVKNYLAIVGRKKDDLPEKAGYYGERFVLKAQSLGLNTCWVGLTHGKTSATIEKGEKLDIVIALGYGERKGFSHPSKPYEELCQCAVPAPDWFKKGMEAAMLSPTAVNQQKFMIIYDGHQLKAKTTSRSFYTKEDLGIVKCDFELASGHSFDK